MNEKNIGWVAGSGGGIGSAAAEALRRVGFSVHCSDRPEEDLTERGVALRVGHDISIGPGVFKAAVFAIGMSGRRYGDAALSLTTDEAWSRVLAVNLTSGFEFLRACLQYMAPGGSIVVVGSALAHSLDFDFTTCAYRVSKAGLESLVEIAAYEGAKRELRVNLVAPGLVDTPMAARALSDRRIRTRFGELMPATKRPATATEVASAISWLCGPDAIQTTGAVIPVDGGWSLGGRYAEEDGGRDV